MSVWQLGRQLRRCCGASLLAARDWAAVLTCFLCAPACFAFRSSLPAGLPLAASADPGRHIHHQRHGPPPAAGRHAGRDPGAGGFVVQPRCCVPAAGVKPMWSSARKRTDGLQPSSSVGPCYLPSCRTITTTSGWPCRCLPVSRDGRPADTCGAAVPCHGTGRPAHWASRLTPPRTQFAGFSRTALCSAAPSLSPRTLQLASRACCSPTAGHPAEPSAPSPRPAAAAAWSALLLTRYASFPFLARSSWATQLLCMWCDDKRGSATTSATSLTMPTRDVACLRGARARALPAARSCSPRASSASCRTRTCSRSSPTASASSGATRASALQHRFSALPHQHYERLAV
jgi:hypothetical protein